MTVNEVCGLIKSLKQVFPVVRLVDAGNNRVLDLTENGELVQAGCCFAIWGKSCRCENCSSERATEERGRVEKYEFLEGEAYHVTSKYVEVDGKGCTLEIVSKFEDRERAFLMAEKKARELKQRDREIIDVLTSEYTGVYFVDLITGEATPYSMNEAIQTEVKDVFQGDIKYIDAYRFCVENLVLEEDKRMMAEAGTIGNIMQELRNKKTFSVIYRDFRGKYCEMKLVKMGDQQGPPEAVALCFSEKDEELRSKEEAARRLKRNLDIIGILASEYTSVYYIDLITDELDTYTMNEETESEFGKIFREGIKYSSAFKMYVDTFVLPEDKERMLKAGSLYNILDELADKKTFVTGYRNSGGRSCEMKFVKVGDDEYPRAVALGFSDKG